jgi:hypothetical protein
LYISNGFIVKDNILQDFFNHPYKNIYIKKSNTKEDYHQAIFVHPSKENLNIIINTNGELYKTHKIKRSIVKDTTNNYLYFEDISNPTKNILQHWAKG